MIFKNRESGRIYRRSFLITFVIMLSIGIVVSGITVSYKNIRKKAFSDNSEVLKIEKDKIKIFDIVIEW